MLYGPCVILVQRIVLELVLFTNRFFKSTNGTKKVQKKLICTVNKYTDKTFSFFLNVFYCLNRPFLTSHWQSICKVTLLCRGFSLPSVKKKNEKNRASRDLFKSNKNNAKRKLITLLISSIHKHEDIKDFL